MAVSKAQIYRNIFQNSWEDQVKTKLDALDLQVLQARAEQDLFNPDLYNSIIKQAESLRDQTQNEGTREIIDEKLARWKIAQRGLTSRLSKQAERDYREDLPAASEIVNNIKAQIEIDKKILSEATIGVPLEFTREMNDNYASVDEEGKNQGYLAQLDFEIDRAYTTLGKAVPETIKEFRTELQSQQKMFKIITTGTDEQRDAYVLTYQPDPFGGISKWDIVSRFDIPSNFKPLGDKKINGMELMYEKYGTDVETGEAYTVLPDGSKAEYDSLAKRWTTAEGLDLDTIMEGQMPSLTYHFKPGEIVKANNKLFRYGDDRELHMLSSEKLLDKFKNLDGSSWRSQVMNNPPREFSFEDIMKWTNSDMIGKALTERDWTVSRREELNNDLREAQQNYPGAGFMTGALSKEFQQMAQKTITAPLKFGVKRAIVEPAKIVKRAAVAVARDLPEPQKSVEFRRTFRTETFPSIIKGTQGFFRGLWSGFKK